MALQKNGRVLQVLDEALCADIVRVAVRQNGLALRWAHVSLCAVPDIVRLGTDAPFAIRPCAPTPPWCAWVPSSSVGGVLPEAIVQCIVQNLVA